MPASVHLAAASSAAWRSDTLLCSGVHGESLSNFLPCIESHPVSNMGSMFHIGNLLWKTMKTVVGRATCSEASSALLTEKGRWCLHCFLGNRTVETCSTKEVRPQRRTDILGISLAQFRKKASPWRSSWGWRPECHKDSESAGSRIPRSSHQLSIADHPEASISLGKLSWGMNRCMVFGHFPGTCVSSGVNSCLPSWPGEPSGLLSSDLEDI